MIRNRVLRSHRYLEEQGGRYARIFKTAERKICERIESNALTELKILNKEYIPMY